MTACASGREDALGEGFGFLLRFTQGIFDGLVARPRFLQVRNNNLAQLVIVEDEIAERFRYGDGIGCIVAVQPTSGYRGIPCGCRPR